MFILPFNKRGTEFAKIFLTSDAVYGRNMNIPDEAASPVANISTAKD